MTYKSFQAEIIKRMLDDREFKNFCQQYEESKLKKGRTRSVTERDINVLHDYKRGMMMSELQSKYRVSSTSINTSLRLAALSKI